MTVLTYLAYLLLAVPLTVWVATTLARNGRVFLADVFAGNEPLADAVNRLLVVGFYLLNLGFVMLYLRVGDQVVGVQGMFNVLSVKLGLVMLGLGVVHLVNVLVFSAMRRHSRNEAQRPRQWAPMPQPAPQPVAQQGGPFPPYAGQPAAGPSHP